MSVSAPHGYWTFLLPSSAEEGRARDGGPTPAPGWCDWRLQKPRVERFELQRWILTTKQLTDASRSIPQTTPVPLRGTSPPHLRRGVQEHVQSRAVYGKQSKNWTALKLPSLILWTLITLQVLPPNEVAAGASSQTKNGAIERYGQLPLSFEQNRGQADPRVRFLTRGTGYRLLLTQTEAVVELTIADWRLPVGQERLLDRSWKIGNGQSTEVRMQLAGANARATVSGLDELPGRVNYLVGSDHSGWKTGIPTYGKVKYQGVYPGIDLVYYGNQGHLEYDFMIAPGADPKVIALNFRGVDQLAVERNGHLLLKIGSRSLRQHKPVVYQEVQGCRKLVSGEYLLNGPRQVGFRIGAYDVSKPLVIDPVLSFSSYLGGQGGDRGYGIALDSAGSVYITGETRSVNFPTVNALQSSYGGDRNDAFVTKLNASGTAILYSTYLGGSGGETAYDIDVDGAGNAYVTGTTYSTNFPTTPNAFQRTIAGGDEAFVTKLNAEGNALVYSTFLGGSGGDDASGIALDSAGNAYVTGGTDSANFPTTAGAFQRTKGAGQSEDVFVTKINSQGSALVYSTYLGS
ncbi:MAG TPA: SBBP repeat-containing protein, partial [Terriglobia bacterium]|nr:SBBP repeat-containing protein [Terriglobia bacterium]